MNTKEIIIEEEKYLIERMKGSIVSLNQTKIFFRYLAHDKEYIETINKISGNTAAIFLDSLQRTLIMKIMHILDDENNTNVSLKRLCRHNDKFIDEFNKKFCTTEQITNPGNKKFIYKYNEEIEKIKKYRNKRLGHEDKVYEFKEDNSFSYKDLYNLVDDITCFFERIYVESGNTGYLFQTIINRFEKRVNHEKSEIIKAINLYKKI